MKPRQPLANINPHGELFTTRLPAMHGKHKPWRLHNPHQPLADKTK